MEHFGRALRQAREARGLTLDEASAVTKIRPHILEALEDWDLARAGHPTFVRGFLKSYCSFLGLDPAPFLEAFSRTSGWRPPSPLDLLEKPVQPPVGALAARRRRAVAVVGALLLALVVGTAILGRPRTSPIRLAQIPSSPTPGNLGAPATVPTPAASVMEVPSPGVFRVVLEVVESRSWVRVTVDGRVVLEGTLVAGDSRVFEGRVIRVVLGNAGAVRVRSVGRDLGVLGGPGEVVRLEFSPEHPEGRRV